MAKTGATGIKRIVNAWGYSKQGLGAAFRHESAFRQEAALMALMLPAAFWLGRSVTEYALLIGALMLVLIVELLNSAVEAVVDRIGDEVHELAGRAKDLASAAVLLALLNVGFVWGLYGYQRLASG